MLRYIYPGKLLLLSVIDFFLQETVYSVLNIFVGVLKKKFFILILCRFQV